MANGTDLTVGVGGRTWIPCGGHENFPDGEVFTGPVESSLEGEVHFSFPASFQGRLVEDVRLVFSGGEVVEATAARGQDFLDGMLAMDDGAHRAGEFAFGLNDAITEFTKNTLFDEKIGGTVHLALGKAYPETGGQNRSALHLGSRVRSPLGERGLRGRRARLPKRALPARPRLSARRHTFVICAS